MITPDDWAARFARAAQMIAQRLDDPPALAELAGAAAVSAFHFHRAWRAFTGETVAQSVLRLRLEAARELLPHGTVTEAALAVGFATPQSFARAFRHRFGTTPSEFKEAPPRAGIPAGFEVTVERRERTVVMALRRLGEYRNLNSAFAAVWNRAAETGVLHSLQGIYGILYDDPATDPPTALRYDACLAVDLPAPCTPFESRELPGGRIARVRHHGSYDGLEAKTQWLCGEWLLGSGFKPADFPVFHHFLNDPDQTPDADLETDIVLPLEGP